MAELHRNDKIKIVIALLAVAGLIFFTLDTIFLLILGFIGWAYMKANSKQDKNSLIRFKMTPASHMTKRNTRMTVGNPAASMNKALQNSRHDFIKGMDKINKDLKKATNQD